MTSPHEGQPQTVATGIETAAGQRRHDSGEIGTSDPQKRATPDVFAMPTGCRKSTLTKTTPRFEDAFIDLLGGAGTSESPLGCNIAYGGRYTGETVIEESERADQKVC